MRRSAWLDKRDEDLWSEVEALRGSDLPPTMTAISEKLYSDYQIASPGVFRTLYYIINRRKKAEADKLALEKLRNTNIQASLEL